MAIILDAPEILNNSLRGYIEKNLFVSIAVAMPDETFIYPKSTSTPQGFPTNMKAGNFPSNKGLFHRKKMDQWLQETAASVFISLTRTVKTNVACKQIFVIYTETGLNNTEAIATAYKIGITSVGLLKKFEEKYANYQHKLFLLDGIVKLTDALPLSESIKKQLTNNREYFIIADFELNKERLIALLKGFSAFKKMQQSNWNLVVVLRATDGIKISEAEMLILNYKYREDVILTDDRQLNEKIAESYALISLCDNEQFPIPIAEAIKMKRPVIAVKTATLESLYGNTIVYTESAEPKAIGEMLMTLYKGETFRKNLIKRIEALPITESLEDAVQTLKQIISA